MNSFIKSNDLKLFCIFTIALYSYFAVSAILAVNRIHSLERELSVWKEALTNYPSRWANERVTLPCGGQSVRLFESIERMNNIPEDWKCAGIIGIVPGDGWFALEPDLKTWKPITQ